MIHQVNYFILFLYFNTDRLEDENNVLGYKVRDYEGLVKREDYDRYIENFSFECYDGQNLTLCKADKDKNRHIYDSVDTFKNLCEPREKRIRDHFPRLEGYSQTSKTIISSFPSIVIVALIVVAIM